MNKLHHFAIHSLKPKARPSPQRSPILNTLHKVPYVMNIESTACTTCKINTGVGDCFVFYRYLVNPNPNPIPNIFSCRKIEKENEAKFHFTRINSLVEAPFMIQAPLVLVRVHLFPNDSFANTKFFFFCRNC